METLIDFLSMQDPNVRNVALGCVLLGISSAVVGVFAFLRKQALVGDAVAHAILPGICLAFMLSGTKNPLYLLAGAFVSGWLSLMAIDTIRAHSPIKSDSAIGLVLSVFFGIGILLLTMIQNSGNAAQSGLDEFLFGQAASLVGNDLIVFSVLAVVLLLTVTAFFKEFSLMAFDEDFARGIGLPVRLLEVILATITVFAIAVGIQAVGVVLMAAMLITPAAAARYWTDRLIVMVVLAAGFGAVSGYFGAFVSYTAPNMPTGPWIVMLISLIAIASLFLAPEKGLVHRAIKRYNNRMKILEENLLKMFYQLGEKDNDYRAIRTVDELQQKRSMTHKHLQKGLKRLMRKGYVATAGDGYALTDNGVREGQRVTRLHRLWELYLSKYLKLAPDHVHEDAEAIEHVITPEIERKLEHMLDYPNRDPHDTRIPYSE